MDDDWIHGVPRPSRPEGWKPYDFAIVTSVSPIVFFPLSEHTWAIETHFDRKLGKLGRSVICEGREDCVYCKAKMARRWIGYLGIVKADLRTVNILQVSQRADLALERIRERNGSIKKVRLKAFRKPRPNKQVRVNDEVAIIEDGPGVADEMKPKPFDPRPTVLWYFGFSVPDIERLLGEDFEHS